LRLFALTSTNSAANPYIAPGEFAKNNAVLLERMVGIAQRLGRDIATPAEARQILRIPRPQ
jgi:3-keto-5-aminohexanoate cleavage enzyme